MAINTFNDGELRSTVRGIINACVAVCNTLLGKGADIASHATTADIGAGTGRNVSITGTTTITAFPTAATGITRRVTFTGALILTHNATSLILPGGANITTAAGDTAQFESLGSGNWLCAAFQRASGKAVVPPAYSEVTGIPAGLTRLIAAPVALTPSAGHIATDAALSTLYRATLAANATLDKPTNLIDGQVTAWEFKQDGTGGWTLTLNAAFVIPSSSSLTSPLNSATFTTAGKTTTLIGRYNQTADKIYLNVETEGY